MRREVWAQGMSASYFVKTRNALPRGQRIYYTHTKSGGGEREGQVAVVGSAVNHDDTGSCKVYHVGADGIGQGGVDMRKAQARTISRLDERHYLREATCRLAHSRAKTAALRNFLFAYLR